MTRLVAAALSLLLLAGADDPQALVREAEAAERAHQPAEAAALYRRSVELEGSSRLSRRARARLAWLEARAEGDYRPLGALMRIQARPRAELSREELDRFAREVEGFPDGRVRREALAFVGSTRLERFDDPRAALESYRAWQASPDIDDAERRVASAGVARALERVEGNAAALTELEGTGLGATTDAVRLRALRFGKIGSVAAAVVLAVFIAAGMALGGWRGARRLRATCSDQRLALAAYVLLVPVALVWLYDARFTKQFGVVSLAMGAAVLCAAVIGAGLEEAPTRRRGALAALGALAVLAAGFVALDRSRLLLDMMLARVPRP